MKKTTIAERNAFDMRYLRNTKEMQATVKKLTKNTTSVVTVKDYIHLYHYKDDSRLLLIQHTPTGQEIALALPYWLDVQAFVSSIA